MSRSSRRFAVVASAFAVLALTATACSEPTTESQVVTEDGGTFDLSPEQADRVRVDKVDEIAAKVPQAIRDRGTLIVTGAGGTAPPLRFYATDDTTIVGSEVDFSYLIADILGLDVDLQVADWSQNFVNIDSG